MQAIIFADRRGDELYPLYDSHCPALLPVANQPLLQYSIEDLAAAGIEDIIIVAADHQPQIEARFGDGARWGVRLRYALSRGEESADALHARLDSLLQPPFLALRGDIYRTPCCQAFVQACAARQAPLLQACSGQTNAGLCLVREPAMSLAALSWPLPAADDGSAWLPLNEVQVAPLTDLRQLFGLNMAELPRALDNPAIPGWQAAPAVKAGRQSRLALSSRASAVLLGEQSLGENHCMVEECVIGDRCLIGRDSRLRRVLVMDDTQVGSHQHIENSILCGHWRIPMDTLRPRHMTDTAEQSNLRQALNELYQQGPERLLGLLLLLLSLPLWPLALLLSLWHQPRQPWLSHWLPSPKAPAERFVRALVFATRIPVLHHLPLLWLVINGRLRLFGGALFSTVPALPSLPAAAPGLLSPRLFALSHRAPPEEVALAELEFASESGLLPLLQRLLRAAPSLCSARAWRAAEEETDHG